MRPSCSHTDGVAPVGTDQRPARSDVVLEPRVFADAFDSLPHPVVVVDETGAVVAHNPAAAKLFRPLNLHRRLRCCDLLRCGREGWPLAGRCMTAAVLQRGRPLTGLELSLEGRSVEITAACLRAGSGAVLHFRMRPGHATGSAAAPALRITTLGSLRLDCGGMDLGGEWLDHRPGQLLKYLISARGSRVPVDKLVEALWPNAGGQGLTSLRQAVHGLRDRLEPGRQKQAPSRFVLSRPNAYELNTASIVVDADEFAREADAALRTAKRSRSDEADAQLASAAQLYRGEFLADEPYADWALRERERLRDLAARVLRELAETHLQAGELPSASSALQRLADLEPLDLDAQRDLMAVMITRRRHGEAARRYELVRRTFKLTFGHELDFALSDLVQGHPVAA
jgi:DNA-binding SARP family transcriptional activator